MPRLRDEVAVRYWRDHKRIVHILDGFDFPWCDLGGHNPRNDRAKGPATCLACIGAHQAFHAGYDVCEECGARVPNTEGGSVANMHHLDTCSLYDPDAR